MIQASAYWCGLYPTSRSIDDLVEPFRTGVHAFLADLTQNGCTVHVSATRRPYERAFLMHWAWCVASGKTTIAAVPRHPGIDIQWTVAGAREMVRTYDLAYEPSLTSRHIAGRAIDMTITGWKGTNPALYALGAKYGVHKLISDPPHWSDDGR